ncbi:MAG: glycosyltransferase [Caldilineales bacterium]|nr:glycosyltransferase [Caldilineales bacterium]
MSQLSRPGARWFARMGSAQVWRRAWQVWQREGLVDLLARLRTRAALRSYAHWLAAQRLSDDDRRDIQRQIDQMVRPPLISVLVPVYNSRPGWLRACLDSVLAQLYPHWELCIADDASTDPQVRAILADYADRDVRVKVIYRPHNGHVAAATNSALALAAGEFVAFLDHDDLLAEHALYLVAAAVREHTDTALLYTDADRCDARGRRFAPAFKPDWSPDLLLAHNYINHLTVLRTELVRRVGGLRPGLEGAQDHDLLLRVSEQIPPAAIHHIPHVLYHWRAHAASLGRKQRARSAATTASRQVIVDCLARRGLDAEVLATVAHPFLHRVRYRLPDPPPLVSVIIPTRDRPDLLRVAVAGVREATDYPAIELIIVDNDSRDPATLGYLSELAKEEDVRVLHQPGPFNYAALNNAAAAQVAGDMLCFLNNDIVVTQSNWLAELVSHALRPEIGAAGPLLRYEDGRIQHLGVTLQSGQVRSLTLRQESEVDGFRFPLQSHVRNVAALTGACLVLRRSIFAEAGGFDEQLAVAYNDVDLCLKLRAAGYWLLCTPFAELVHLGSASRGGEDSPEKQARLRREADTLREKWGAFAASDPFTNPNLTWRRGCPEMAFPSAAPCPWRRSDA